VFYDLQNISIPFAEYQISEEEKAEIKLRSKNLFIMNDLVDLTLEETNRDKLYSFYIFDKKGGEYILVVNRMCCAQPYLIHLTHDGDWIDNHLLEFLLYRAKAHQNILRFHITITKDAQPYYIAKIRQQLHTFALVPEDRNSKEYIVTYFENMQLLLMMLYDIDYQQVFSQNPKIEEELEQIFPIEDVSPYDSWQKELDELIYVGEHAQFY